MTDAEKSALLVTAAAAFPGQGAMYEGAAAREAAAVAVESLPLPHGATSIELTWETMGPIADGDIALMLQMNAACRWYSAVLGGARDELTLSIIKQIPSWSALRNGSLARALQGISTSTDAGDPAAMQQFVDTNCGKPSLRARG